MLVREANSSKKTSTDRLRSIGMLDVEVCPGTGAGAWLLGSTISEALAVVNRQPRIVPRAVIAHQEATSPSTDLAVHLPDNGLLLRFDPYSQRLRCIEVHDVSKVRLIYKNQVFSAPDVLASFQLVYARFGPSVPGDYQASSRLYLLSYPGLTMAFPIPEVSHFALFIYVSNYPTSALIFAVVDHLIVAVSSALHHSERFTTRVA